MFCQNVARTFSSSISTCYALFKFPDLLLRRSVPSATGAASGLNGGRKVYTARRSLETTSYIAKTKSREVSRRGRKVLKAESLVLPSASLLPEKEKGDVAKVVRRRSEVMASSITRLVRRPVAALFLLKSYRHVRSFSHHIYPGITAQGCPNSRRELCGFLPRVSQYQLWSRSFSSDNADLAEAVVPFMGESITDGTLATFLKKPGDRVAVDEPIAQIETDKVTIDVVSPEAGVIEKFVAKEGDTVTPGTKIAFISKSDSSDTHVTPSEKPDHDTPKSDAKEKDKAKSNVEEQIKEKPSVVTEIKEKPKVTSSAPPKLSASEPQLPPKERERRVSMPRIRKRVATRLKDSQNTYAMLTTFNEVDMTNLMKLRSDYKDAFVEKHGTKLGLMSGFVKAAVSGLQQLPIVNAVIDGEDIIYRDYIDISIAVGTPKGLVVPVLRDADKLNFAEVEKNINTLAKRANEGTISIDEMAGGTFTISNGGVFGSLLSTPIINPPQSAILGMHSIVSRPMVVNGTVVPRPMMYIALTYDHRLIDGREAVYFLRRIKDVVEDPRRLLLDL